MVGGTTNQLVCHLGGNFYELETVPLLDQLVRSQLLSRALLPDKNNKIAATVYIFCLTKFHILSGAGWFGSDSR